VKYQLEAENTWIRKKLQEKEGQLETMASLSMEENSMQDARKIIFLIPQRTMAAVLDKTIAQRGIMPFQDYR